MPTALRGRRVVISLRHLERLCFTVVALQAARVDHSLTKEISQVYVKCLPYGNWPQSVPGKEVASTRWLKLQTLTYRAMSKDAESMR